MILLLEHHCHLHVDKLEIETGAPSSMILQNVKMWMGGKNLLRPS